MMSGPQSDKARAYLLQHPKATTYEVAAGSGCSARTARRVKARNKAFCNGIGDDDSGGPLGTVAYLEKMFGFDRVGASHDYARTDIFQRNPSDVFGCYAVFPDIHAPYQDDRALDAAIDHVLKRHKTTGVILPGDFADNYEFSRYPGTPRMSALSEVNAVKVVLKRVADAFPGGDNTALMGNHEMRFVRYMQVNAPKAAEVLGDKVPEVFGLSEIGFKFHDNQESWARGGGYFKIGKLTYIHGHELPGCAGKYAAQRVAELHRGNILFAHLHKTCASTPLRDIDGKVIRAWGMGCLHTRTPDYMPGASHTLGFAVVEYDSDGSGHFTIYNYLLDDNYKVRM